MSFWPIRLGSPPLILQKPKGPDFKVFATMCIHRHIDPEAFHSMIPLLLCSNPRFSFSKRRGDALIDRARAMEASRFLAETDYEVLLFLDDDIIYKFEDAIKIVREVHEGYDIVGGAYTLKADGGEQFNIKFLADNKQAPFGLEGGLIEVRMVSTGFMAIHRRVFEQMSLTMPLCTAQKAKFYPFFQPFPKEIDGKWYYLSEDWAFCERARDLGFKVWCDTSLKIKHAGRYVYDWDDFQRGKKQIRDNFIYSENVPG